MIGFPKPKDTKKKKKVNGYKSKPKRICYYCGTYGADRHEIYGGPNRQTSIDLEFQIDLCEDCHRKFHNPPNDLWISRILFWRQRFQKKYETILMQTGISKQHARDCWMELIGRNYLDD